MLDTSVIGCYARVMFERSRRVITDPQVWVERRVVRDASGCWIWRGTTDAAGYARTVRGVAHREVWRRLVGQLGVGVVLHHICGRRACVRPEHLAPTARNAHMRDHAAAWALTPEARRVKRAACMRDWIACQRRLKLCRQCRRLAAAGRSLCNDHRLAENARKARRRSSRV